MSLPKRFGQKIDNLWRVTERPHLNVSRTSEMEQWAQRKVETGLHSSASKVVREALWALHAKETRNSRKIMRLRDAIQESLVSLKDS